MTRIPLLHPADMTEAQAKVYNNIASGPRGGVFGPLAVWLNRPELADKAQMLGRYCRYDSSLPPKLSELAILVTARIWDADFEWQSHVNEARKAGLSEKIINALAQDEKPDFTDEGEAIVYRVSCELNLERRISDTLYQQAEKKLGTGQLVDLIGVLGYYSLISMTIKAFDVDPLNKTNDSDE